MTDFAIAFDLPGEDDPRFAGSTRSGLGFVDTLDEALKFSDEETAFGVLFDSYGPELNGYGAVVEVCHA